MLQEYNNPLADKEFLEKLDASRDRQVYARITALDFQEQPVERIEGEVTQGSISIDGASAVRRTCSLTLVANNIKISDFYWGVKSKFKLEIGLKNTINIEKYPEIIWFPQGVYVITTFNTSQNGNSATISVSGKDKMCLVNGDIGGNLTASIDFGVEEVYDIDTDTINYNRIPIKNIIREALHAYVGEPYHNIVLNDLDESSVELLEYRGDVPLYLVCNVDTGEFENYTLNGDMVATLMKLVKDKNGKDVYVEDTTQAPRAIKDFEKTDNDPYKYDTRVELAADPEKQASVVTFGTKKEKINYTVAKVEYGQTAGYRYTDLTYPGDLISGVGEALTSILDKIKNMLGEYEYFYDLDGRFVFQRKKNYLQNNWNNIVKAGGEMYVEPAAYSSAFSYRFEDNKLITSFQNSPVLNNLKNDFSVWGEREGVSGAKIPIHYRYAIDIKPKTYYSITQDKQVYIVDDKQATRDGWKRNIVDWREIIYRMAEDYYKQGTKDEFAALVMENNPEMLNGKTGYEQYYIDIYGFWRQLYDPSNPQSFISVVPAADTFDYDTENGLYLKKYFQQVSAKDVRDTLESSNVYIYIEGDPENNKLPQIVPLLDGIKIEKSDLDSDDSYQENTNESKKFGVAGVNSEGVNTIVSLKKTAKDYVDKHELYVKNSDGTYSHITKSSSYISDSNKYYVIIDGSDYKEISEIIKDDDKLKNIYFSNYDSTPKKVRKNLEVSRYDKYGDKISGTESSTPISYYTSQYKYLSINEENTVWNGWIKDVLKAPDQLNFWFDFMDANYSDLGQFSVKAIGDRTKVVNDNSIRSIYFREVPNLIFATQKDWENSDLKYWSGYTTVRMTSNLENMFSISAQGKSAQDELDSLLYNHSYCIENVTIQAIPVYYLQPNTRIFVRDDLNGIEGEYLVSKISLPLAYNGTMSITATKAPQRLM